MKILLDDGLQVENATGIGSYARYLGQSLENLPDTHVTYEKFAPKKGRIASRLSYLRYLESAAYQKKLQNFDVVHYANYALPKKHPKGTVVAVTVHDLAAFSQKKTLPRAYAAYNRFMVRRAMAKADIIFTVSESMKKEIVTRFPRAQSKVLAVYPGHYTEATVEIPPAAYENRALAGLERGRFFLHLGTVETRKNTAELIDAYNLFQKTYPGAHDFALVLAGRYGIGIDEVLSRIHDAPDTADIRLSGFVSNADRQKLLGEAAALVFPSIYEGFGSPQTEAMAAGLPLILSDIPTNREVSGAYGSYYPLGDPCALAALLKKVACGKITPNKELAKQHLARFVWHESAQKIRAAFEAALPKK